MIIHEHQLIFIHIPKNAGTSIEKYFYPDFGFEWNQPNYDLLYGWCPKRKIHLQHATPYQLLETELISETLWNNYEKFAVIRNPWERAVSDFHWMCAKSRIRDSFSNYLDRKNKFKKILNDSSDISYRGDHLIPQTEYTSLGDSQVVDTIIKFENLSAELNDFLLAKGLPPFNVHINQGNKPTRHYSTYYGKSHLEKMGTTYQDDIILGDYTFEDRRSVWRKKINAWLK